MKIMIMMLKIMKMMLPMLMAVAFMVLMERKILGYMQLRKGPSMVGPYGIMQTVADGMKLFIKEKLKPTSATPALFFVSPAMFLFLALMLWTMMPCPKPKVKMKLSLMLIMGMSSLSVYSLLGSGWASKSKYSLMGGMRAVAQTMSYEMSMSTMLLSIALLSSKFNLMKMMKAQSKSWFLFSCLPLSYMWFISSLAETKRTPFDLTEGESELVSGYKVEYAGGPFALFFLAEYAKMMLMKLLSTMLFLGGKLPMKMFPMKTMSMAMKTSMLSSTFLWMRASFPRLRYDQLMFLKWKSYLPFSMSFLLWKMIMMKGMKMITPVM